MKKDRILNIILIVLVVLLMCVAALVIFRPNIRNTERTNNSNTNTISTPTSNNPERNDATEDENNIDTTSTPESSTQTTNGRQNTETESNSQQNFEATPDVQEVPEDPNQPSDTPDGEIPIEPTDTDIGEESDDTEPPETPDTDEDSRPLEGMIICIDPGHQGRGDSTQEPIAPGSTETKAKVSSGTQGAFTRVAEYVLNLEVGLMLRDKLEELGAIVIMTRTTHDINISNSERAILANDNNCDMVIRIHANGSTDSSVRGYCIMIPGSLYTPNIVSDSRYMAEVLDSILPNYVSIPSLGLLTMNDLTGFNWLIVPGILLEMGFMTNRTDDETMQTAEFHEGVTDAMVDALIRYWVG